MIFNVLAEALAGDVFVAVLTVMAVKPAAFVAQKFDFVFLRRG